MQKQMAGETSVTTASKPSGPYPGASGIRERGGSRFVNEKGCCAVPIRIVFGAIVT